MAQITVTGFDTDNNAVPVTVVTQLERNELQRRNLQVEISRLRQQQGAIAQLRISLRDMANRGDNLGWEIQHGEAMAALQAGADRLYEQETRMRSIMNAIPR